jgi:hypothetical protein
MLISQIDLFIQCAKALLPKHQKSTPQQKRQIETFLKTWLFYNSSSAEVFWTGLTSQSVIDGAQPIAEHWFGNLSSAHYVMNLDVQSANFFDQAKPAQILEVFKFMQWNKTSKAENIKLRALQRPEVFFAQFQGDPRQIYQLAGIHLIQRGHNTLNEIESFFDYGSNGSSNAKKTIFDIGMAPKRQLVNFRDNLILASTSIGLELKFVQVSNKGCFYRINNEGIQNSMASFYRITMTALWGLFRNQEEVSQFLATYNYQISSNTGPYRNANTFDDSYGSYSFCINLLQGVAQGEIWLWSRNNDERKYLQIMELFEYFGASLVVYDYNLDLRNLGDQLRD